MRIELERPAPTTEHGCIVSSEIQIDTVCTYINQLVPVKESELREKQTKEQTKRSKYTTRCLDKNY